jgi:hypothetical protein
MIKAFLMTTAVAVLVAGTGPASAQDGRMNSQSPAPAAAPTVQAPEGKMAPAPNAQAPQTATDGRALTTEQEKKAFGPLRTDTPR